MIQELIRDYFPMLNEAALVRSMEENATIMEAAEGESLVEIGNYIKFMPLVCKGMIKVLRQDENGDELFLYYLGQGQTCAMTFTCCMANNPSEVTAMVEEDSLIIAVPMRMMEEWFRTYRSWQNFVLTTYNERFNELLHALDSIAFLHLDERLLNYLNQKAEMKGSSVIETTHQRIAFDLNSSREVISRLLKQLEKRGLIKLSRNKVEIV